MLTAATFILTLLAGAILLLQRVRDHQRLDARIRSRLIRELHCRAGGARIRLFRREGAISRAEALFLPRPRSA
jgi:hypothetical protein